MTRAAAGFTLVEVLVALSVFAMLSLAGTTILGQSLNAKAQSDQVNRATKELQIANAILRADFGQMIIRVGRDGYGARTDGGVVFSESGQPVITLVRNGWENPGGQAARSSLQRVEYLVAQDNLVRRAYPYVDGSADANAFEQVLMTGVSNATFSYLLDGVWQGWVNGAGTVSVLPEAVAIEVKSAVFGEVRQLFLAPGGRL